MHFVKLKYTGKSYAYDGGSSIEMDILSNFLSSDVRCSGSSFKEWALENSDMGTSSNITELEKEEGYICLRDLYSQESTPTILKMTTKQFIQILDDWEVKVCKARPQEVTIKYESDQLSIETHS